MHDAIELPDLPEPDSFDGIAGRWSFIQMRAYARAAVLSDRERRGQSGTVASTWQPMETAPEDGTKILIARIENGAVLDVINGHFEIVAHDEDDGPWDIRDGEPWCSYEGRAAGIYFCHWLPGGEIDSRWRFGPNTEYSHWTPLPGPPYQTSGAEK